MAHTLVLGQTGAGKSTYCKWLCKALKPTIETIVYNPHSQPGWDCDFQSADPQAIRERVEQVGREGYPCVLFLEEASALSKDPQWDWFTTFSRNCGCTCYVIAQRLKMLSPSLRSNCESVILFRSATSDTREIADEYREPALLDVGKIPNGEFYVVRGDAPLMKSHLDFRRKNFATPKIVA